MLINIVKEVSGLEYKPGILYVTNSVAVADYLKTNDYPYAVFVKDEEECTSFWGHDYILIGIENVTADNEWLCKIYNRQSGSDNIIARDDTICIRETRIEDVSRIYEMYDSECNKYLEPLPKLRKDEYADYISGLYRQYDMYGYGMYVIEHKAYKKVIGRIGLEAGKDGAYLGYMIDKDYRNKGYARGAVKIFLAKIKEEYPDICIRAKVDSSNIPSVKILKKYGLLG